MIPLCIVFAVVIVFALHGDMFSVYLHLSLSHLKAITSKRGQYRKEAMNQCREAMKDKQRDEEQQLLLSLNWGVITRMEQKGMTFDHDFYVVVC